MVVNVDQNPKTGEKSILLDFPKFENLPIPKILNLAKNSKSTLLDIEFFAKIWNFALAKNSSCP